MRYISIIIFLVLPSLVSAQEVLDKNIVLTKVNEVRTRGCYCGRRWMEATVPLIWNDKLAKSAFNHARDMDKYNFFGHYSHDGRNIGSRIDEVGFKWKKVGENIAEGQINLEEVIEDWVKSREHCLMLMNPQMREMGLVKYKDLWVHHFGLALEVINNN